MWTVTIIRDPPKAPYMTRYFPKTVYSKEYADYLEYQVWKRGGEAIVERSFSLDDREIAGILAGLRLLQARLYDKFLAPMPPWEQEEWMKEIATNGGELEMLGLEEIDNLCEMLNVGKENE